MTTLEQYAQGDVDLTWWMHCHEKAIGWQRFVQTYHNAMIAARDVGDRRKAVKYMRLSRDAASSAQYYLFELIGLPEK